jgi:hypothetical protein
MGLAIHGFFLQECSLCDKKPCEFKKLLRSQLQNVSGDFAPETGRNQMGHFEIVSEVCLFT